jgi:hypothetical protein
VNDRHPLRTACAAVVLVVAGGRLAGCSGTTPPDTKASPVAALVAGPASAYASVVVAGGNRQAPVPPSLLDEVAPLLVARVFDPAESPGTFGLDHPRAHVVYRRRDGTTIDVALGAPTFDRHFVYAQRSGQPTVALVAASVADRLLVLVGVDVSPPT